MPPQNAPENKPAPPQIRLVVVDDNSIFLTTLVRHLTHDERMVVVGTATNAQDGLRLTTELHPDITIIDLQMPGVNGLALISLIRRQMPDVCIVAMTLHVEEPFKRAAFERGAHGFIQKDAIATELNPLIHNLYQAGCSNRQNTELT